MLNNNKSVFMIIDQLKKGKRIICFKGDSLNYEDIILNLMIKE